MGHGREAWLPASAYLTSAAVHTHTTRQHTARALLHVVVDSTPSNNRARIWFWPLRSAFRLPLCHSPPDRHIVSSADSTHSLSLAPFPFVPFPVPPSHIPPSLVPSAGRFGAAGSTWSEVFGPPPAARINALVAEMAVTTLRGRVPRRAWNCSQRSLDCCLSILAHSGVSGRAAVDPGTADSTVCGTAAADSSSGASASRRSERLGAGCTASALLPAPSEPSVVVVVVVFVVVVVVTVLTRGFFASVDVVARTVVCIIGWAVTPPGPGAEPPSGAAMVSGSARGEAGKPRGATTGSVGAAALRVMVNRPEVLRAEIGVEPPRGDIARDDCDGNAGTASMRDCTHGAFWLASLGVAGDSPAPHPSSSARVMIEASTWSALLDPSGTVSAAGSRRVVDGNSTVREEFGPNGVGTSAVMGRLVWVAISLATSLATSTLEDDLLRDCLGSPREALTRDDAPTIRSSDTLLVLIDGKAPPASLSPPSAMNLAMRRIEQRKRTRA